MRIEWREPPPPRTGWTLKRHFAAASIESRSQALHTYLSSPPSSRHDHKASGSERWGYNSSDDFSQRIMKLSYCQKIQITGKINRPKTVLRVATNVIYPVPCSSSSSSSYLLICEQEWSPPSFDLRPVVPLSPGQWEVRKSCYVVVRHCFVVASLAARSLAVVNDTNVHVYRTGQTERYLELQAQAASKDCKVLNSCWFVPSYR